MKPNKYQRKAIKNALYRTQDTWYYPLGLCGEVGELVQAIDYQYDRVDILHEIGDVLWYTSAMADSIGFSLSEVIGSNSFKEVKFGVVPKAQIVTCAALVAEQVKKCYRNDGGELSEERQDTVIHHLKGVLACLRTLAHGQDHTLSEVANMNIKKITCLKAAGKVTG